MKILCIGNASYDITVPFDGYPEENTKTRVNDLIECGGGPASNAAYLLGKWGMDEVYFAGVVGNDLYGKTIKDEFEGVGIKTDYLELRDGLRTTVSFIIANKEKGTRTILTHRSSEAKMENFELDFYPDLILFDGQEYEMTKKLLETYPHAISIIDAGRPREEIIELAKMSTYVACGHEFAETLANMKVDYNNSNDLISMMSKLKEIFPNSHVLVTLEDKGAVYEEDGVVKIMPSIEVTAVDSTGAGDLFHGAFAYAIANKYSYSDAIKIGNVSGALSVTRIGGRNSVASKEDMKRVLYDFR